MAYHESPVDFSPLKSCYGNPPRESLVDFAEPLDFSTRKDRIPTPESRSHRMTTPESGVSSLSAGSPFRMSPERDSPPRPQPNLLSLFGNQLPKHDATLGRKMEEGEGSSTGWKSFSSSMKNQEPVAEMGMNPRVAHPPQLPSILVQLQQTHPLLLSTLCNLASQRVAEMAGSPPVRPIPMPQMQAPQVPQMPPMPFMGFPMGSIPGPMMGLSPVDLLHTPQMGDLEDENMTVKSNESYLQFRAQMMVKGQIGSKARRSHVRSSSNCQQMTDQVSSDDSSEKGEKRWKEDLSSEAADSPQGGAGSSQKDPIKNAAYYERRKKNNEAAKRSRDARRAKEDEIAIRAAFLETENLQLRNQVSELKATIRKLYQIHGV